MTAEASVNLQIGRELSQLGRDGRRCLLFTVRQLWMRVEVFVNGNILVKIRATETMSEMDGMMMENEARCYESLTWVGSMD